MLANILKFALLFFFIRFILKKIFPSASPTNSTNGKIKNTTSQNFKDTKATNDTIEVNDYTILNKEEKY